MTPDPATFGAFIVAMGASYQMATALTPLSALRRVVERNETWLDRAKDPAYQTLVPILAFVGLLFLPESTLTTMLMAGVVGTLCLFGARLVVLVFVKPQQAFKIHIDQRLRASDQDLVLSGPPAFTGWMLVVVGSGAALLSAGFAFIVAIGIGTISAMVANKRRRELLEARFRSTYRGRRNWPAPPRHR